ncbi:MAG: hypothetical protein KGL40_02865 [Rhodocyclaceae bacterium]|nr:hypothetical protein [Rhodocyclaceae bacterium]
MSADKRDASNTTPPAAGAATRRKLLKLGAGSMPVLMAFASRSAFACHSTTPSAFGSVCASRPDLLQSSSGQSPGYWKTHTGTGYWPSPYYSNDVRVGKNTYKASTFKGVFCATGAPNPYTDSTTLLDVLESGGGGNRAVARACVAALLNARSGRTPNTIMTANDVIDIWYQYATKGYFEPVVGVKWYSDTPQLPYIAGSNDGGKGGIVGYLNTTWS